MDGSSAMSNIAEMKKKFEEKKKAMQKQVADNQVGESEDILVVDDDPFQLNVLTTILKSCSFASDNADGGASALAKYKQRVNTFIEGMKKLEYVSEGAASSKYMSDDMLFENLIRNVLPPARFIISDDEMPELKGTDLCALIRDHFNGLVSKLVNGTDAISDFSGIQSCVPSEQMGVLLDKFKPILIIVSAYTDDPNLQQDC